MPNISFIVQGLSKRRIDEMVASAGIAPARCTTARLSPFKSIWRIGTLQTENAEKPDNAKEEAPDRKKPDPGPEQKKDDFPDLSILEFPIRVISGIATIGEAGLILLLLIFAFLIITGSFFLWMFISIPILLLILSFITLGDAWKMISIYRIDLKDPKDFEIRKEPV